MEEFCKSFSPDTHASLFSATLYKSGYVKLLDKNIVLDKLYVGYMMKVKTQCTYGRGGEEINDTTRHDYVSLELNTLRVGKKMEIRVVYKHTPFPPPFGHPLLLPFSHTSPSLLAFFFFFKDPFVW